MLFPTVFKPNKVIERMENSLQKWNPSSSLNLSGIYSRKYIFHAWFFFISYWFEDFSTSHRNSHRRCSVRKIALTNFASGLWLATLSKRRRWQRCFPVKFAKCLRILFFRTPLVAVSEVSNFIIIFLLAQKIWISPQL